MADGSDFKRLEALLREHDRRERELEERWGAQGQYQQAMDAQRQIEGMMRAQAGMVTILPSVGYDALKAITWGRIPESPVSPEPPKPEKKPEPIKDRFSGLIWDDEEK